MGGKAWWQVAQGGGSMMLESLTSSFLSETGNRD